MIIQTLVEGQGDEQALPVLLRRLQQESGAFHLHFDHPIRRRRSDFGRETTLRAAIRLALNRERGCEGILIVFDSDLDCPKELADRIRFWVQTETRGKPCEVVMAHREYEAWFLASLESLRGHRGIRTDARAHPRPESVRGAKEKLQAAMVRGRDTYVERTDQPALTALFDLAAAYRSCRSFRRMVRAFGLLASAAGAEVGDWPPPAWLRRA
ncbi:MAG TPA: DUF4276 family protein [Thermoanaerobaculia bacterium]